MDFIKEEIGQIFFIMNRKQQTQIQPITYLHNLLAINSSELYFQLYIGSLFIVYRSSRQSSKKVTTILGKQSNQEVIIPSYQKLIQFCQKLFNLSILAYFNQPIFERYGK